MSIINLRTPIRSERVRAFQPPWRTLFVYECQTCKKETRVFASAFRGKTPEPGSGGIMCPHCDHRREVS